MRIYLISDLQIQKLYRAVTAGSRDFERVIQTIKLSQEVTLGAVKLLKTEHEKTIQNIGGDQGDQPGQTETVPRKKTKGSKGAGS